MHEVMAHDYTARVVGHLYAAQDARARYDATLTAAIDHYGDRNGPFISAIYSDHFPEDVKTRLRAYARIIAEHTGHALASWRKARRRLHTFRRVAEGFRTLPDGSISYY